VIALSDDQLRVAFLEHGAREYQANAALEIVQNLRVHRSTLAVLATGLGKTHLFSILAALWPGRVLVLAHRRELIVQAWTKLTELTGGERVGIEKAGEHSHGARIVVGSIQTLKESRLRGIAEPPFSLIVVDEAHHCTANSYRKVLGAFPGAKVLGVTATPRRGDRAAMGRVFDSATTPLDLSWGIENGWLTPLDMRPIKVDIDFGALKVQDGEFDQGELDDAIARCAAEITAAALEHAGQRRMVGFAPGVKTAHVTAERMNISEPGSARSIDGTTPDDERASILRGHKTGRFVRLMNCQVLTEGFDDPELICILNALPCKAQSRLTQIIGRATRPWPGCEKLATVDERRAAIAASPKPYAVIYDLAGNNMEGCASIVDILGGSFTDDEKKAAKKKLATGGDVRAALEEARKEIREAAARAVRLRAKTTVGERVDPFKVLAERDPEPMRVMKPENAATREQLKILRDELYMEIPPNCSRAQAQRLIQIGDQRARAGLLNYRQIRWLDKFGINGRDMTVTTGKAIADAFIANGKLMPDRATVNRIIAGAQREALAGVAD
jgi:superfamily II DNA or RNA helicase